MSRTPREVGDGIWVVTGGSFPSNSYICKADLPGGAILVDANLDAAAIDAALQALRLLPHAVYCTHGHFDHLGSAAFFQRKYGAPVFLHRADLKTAQINNFLLTALKRSERIELPEFTYVDDGHTEKLGAELLSFIHLPGHTPGSCAIAIGQNLFTGDTIYSRGVGLSKLPGERPDLLRESILRLWERLDDWMVHPGHGESSSGATIRAANSALKAFLQLEDSDAPREGY